MRVFKRIFSVQFDSDSELSESESEESEPELSEPELLELNRPDLGLLPPSPAASFSAFFPDLPFLGFLRRDWKEANQKTFYFTPHRSTQYVHYNDY